jgi:hypothetical protein
MFMARLSVAGFTALVLFGFSLSPGVAAAQGTTPQEVVNAFLNDLSARAQGCLDKLGTPAVGDDYTKIPANAKWLVGKCLLPAVKAAARGSLFGPSGAAQVFFNQAVAALKQNETVLKEKISGLTNKLTSYINLPDVKTAAKEVLDAAAGKALATFYDKAKDCKVGADPGGDFKPAVTGALKQVLGCLKGALASAGVAAGVEGLKTAFQKIVDYLKSKDICNGLVAKLKPLRDIAGQFASSGDLDSIQNSIQQACSGALEQASQAAK